jgi:hypothetical protein
MAYFAVDRIEGSIAVLIGADRAQHDVPRKQLPKGTGEGSVLDVPLDAGGQPVWAGARLDAAERERRLARARAMLEELKKGDPGGDIVL